MITFNYSFTVNAPLSAVSSFHQDTRILKKLMPPPLFVQLHRFDPLGENSVAEFTIWFGPIPVRWTAIHNQVSKNGFTDTQLQGPLKLWQHTHQFTAVSYTTTQVSEHIQYEHPPGWRGLITRLLFGKPGLWVLFTYRQLITRWYIHQLSIKNRQS